MRKFYLLEQSEIKNEGMLMVVIPFEPITFREIKILKDENKTVIIDDEKFTVLGYEDDFLFHDPDELFSFFGNSLIGLLVAEPYG